MSNTKEKILIWKPAQWMKNLTVKEIAVMYLQLEVSFEEFNKEKLYNEETLVFNPKAFHNAFKQESGRKPNSLKAAITKMRISYKTDKKQITKVQNQMQIKFDKLEKGYDKFDLIFGDILFAPKFFADPKGKSETKKIN